MTEYLQRGHIRYVTSLHVQLKLCSDITMDFLKLSPVFTKCSVVYLNIPVNEDHTICMSQLWTLVYKQSGFNFLISVPDNWMAEQCTTTFNTHVVPTIGYPYYIVFNWKTFFMLLHFQRWAAGKEIKLVPTNVYYSQMESQSEIVYKEILQVTRACKAEGNI